MSNRPQTVDRTALGWQRSVQFFSSRSARHQHNWKTFLVKHQPWTSISQCSLFQCDWICHSLSQLNRVEKTQQAQQAQQAHNLLMCAQNKPNFFRMTCSGLQSLDPSRINAVAEDGCSFLSSLVFSFAFPVSFFYRINKGAFRSVAWAGTTQKKNIVSSWHSKIDIPCTWR